MSLTMNANQFCTVSASDPKDATGASSKATLSNTRVVSDNESVFTTTPNPNDASAPLVLGVGAGTANIIVTVTATELDGSSHDISQTDSVTINAVSPPVQPATSFTITFSTPQDQVPTAPPIPK